MRPQDTVALRRIPYPYRAILAICSDLDETPDSDTYVETLRFLNTTADTRFGRGVGLEVGNTIYFDMPQGQFSYWNTDDRGRARTRTLIRSGHVDCLHSFGDLATTRRHAARALDELDSHGCPLQVWIDHAVAPSNFGADRMQGAGDLQNAPIYHADLTWAHGVRYVWRGRVTSVTGQGVRRRLGGIFDARHPLMSARTFVKETAKGIAARRAGNRYALHQSNDVLRAATLRSGQPVYEFLRANPHWGGVNRGETAWGIGEVITARMLRRLQARAGTCILYTHLGKTPDRHRPFGDRGLTALRHLARERREGRVLVMTTRRVLGYTLAARTAAWTIELRGNELHIQLRTTDPVTAADAQGLTFYVPDPRHARISLNGVPCAVQQNPEDHTGRPSVSLPIHPLEFPGRV